VSPRELVVGTRGSALALAQTEIVCRELRRIDPSIAIRVERITTTGDVRDDVPLSQLGRGIFVTEIETALRTGRIDLAVHSAKDLPSVLASDLTLGAILPRADARDVLVSPYGTLRKLPVGARVGTSSPRRACQLRALRTDLEPMDVRGNVDTRLRKLAAGEFDALVLAAAGLIRLGREAEITQWMDADWMIPSVGQGALAVEVRADDQAMLRLVRQLDDASTRAAVTAERAFLAELGAGCRAAAGAHARVDRDRQLRIAALIGSVDGEHVRATRTGDLNRPEELGCAIARELLREGGAAFLAKDASALAGKTLAITRPAGQSAELEALLRAHGAEPVSCPTIAIEQLADTSTLDSELDELAALDWLLFTSVNAVHAIADRLSARQMRVPAAVLLAAVGVATADALARRIRPADFVPSLANGQALADELPEVRGKSMLFARGDLASDALSTRLRQRGALVRDVVVYRTVAAEGQSELAARVRDGSVDAVVFTSPSSVRFATGVLDAVRLAHSGRPAIVCIGPTTERAARDIGLEPDAVAATQSVGGIVEALERSLAAREHGSAILAH
jgi:hydroxymethylbilane synthase